MFLTLDKTARRKLQETFVTYRMEHEFTQAGNLRPVPERHLLRPALLRRRRGGRGLLRQDARQARRRRGGDHRRRAQGAVALQSRSSIRRPPPRAAPTCCGACASSATSTPRPPRPPTRSRWRRARTRRCLTSRRPTSRRWRAWSCAQRFGPAAETAGYKVYTTIDGRLQTAANRAVRVGLIEYDRRHGWRGPAGARRPARARRAGLRRPGRRVRRDRQSLRRQ